MAVIKVAIIGGGASGLVSAIEAVRRGREVHLYEQESKVAKKILASGNGRCNISNTSLAVENYFSQHPSIVQTALNRFGFKELEKFFERIGLVLEIKPDGRAYPFSNEAKAVSNALLNMAKKEGVKVYIDAKILSVRKDKTFTLETESETYEGFDKVMIATGSSAAPQLGSNDSGFGLAQGLGHKIVPTYPSLVALEAEGTSLMSGAKIQALISVYVDKKQRIQKEGDVLFTKYGISGFGVLDVSQVVSVALMEDKEVMVGLNLLPFYERGALVGKIQSLAKHIPSHDAVSLLCAFIPQKMALGVLKSCEITPEILVQNLNQKQLRKISNTLQDWRFLISDTHGFKHAEVSGGGVDVAYIDAKTYGSKLVNGLYFGGEVLDVVGERGGYNLHFAFASGFVVGASI